MAVRRLRRSLPDAWVWDGRDLLVLGLAERQARDLDRLEGSEDVKAMREARNQRLALLRLISQLDVPAHGTGSAIKARRAAEARWRGSAAS